MRCLALLALNVWSEVFKYFYQVLVKSFGGMVVPLNDNKIFWRNILISSMSSWELLNHGGW